MKIAKYTYQLSLFVLIIFYSVGVFGMLGNDGLKFAGLTPLNLVISLCILLMNHKSIDKRAVLALVIVAIYGYLIEVVGVATGVIFGEYHYGENLGPKIFDVPLMLGVNWAILIYCCYYIATKISRNIYLRASIGSTLMVLIDFFIEPVAINFDFWHWQGNGIPLQNYFAWWVISFVILIPFGLLIKDVKNKIAIPLFLIQLIFFILISSFIH